jgi:hypothetical protein
MFGKETNQRRIEKNVVQGLDKFGCGRDRQMYPAVLPLSQKAAQRAFVSAVDRIA